VASPPTNADIPEHIGVVDSKVAITIIIMSLTGPLNWSAALFHDTAARVYRLSGSS
jgi:hypothetical protein